MPHRLLSLLLGTCMGLLLMEGTLRALAWLPIGLESRLVAAQPKPDGEFRIICVGDSNTYGAGVRRDEAYPARLKAILNHGSSRDSIEVINLGVPGTNSAQLANRLAEYVDVYEPDLVIVLIGVNDFWNPAEMEFRADRSWSQLLHAGLMRSRLYRLVFLTLVGLGEQREALPEDDVLLTTQTLGQARGENSPEAVHEIRHGDRAFRFENRRIDPVLAVDTHRTVLASNLKRIQRTLDAAAVPLVLPSYASGLSRYGVANAAIEAIDDVALHVPLGLAQIRSYLPMRYLLSASKKSLYFPDLHPKPPLYRAYALGLCSALVSKGLVPVDSCGTP